MSKTFFRRNTDVFQEKMTRHTAKRPAVRVRWEFSDTPYEHKPAMTLIGFSTLIRMEEGYTRCPGFWDVEYNRKYARL